MKRGVRSGAPSEKRARATFKPHRHAGLVEVEVPADLPMAPHWLTPEGREAWLDLVPRVQRSRAGCELDSVLLATLANLCGACAAAWGSGAAPPASYLSELRRLSELFGLAGVTSRVVSVIHPRADNPFKRPRPTEKAGNDAS